MLSPHCQAFRLAFSPQDAEPNDTPIHSDGIEGNGSSHRLSCEACDAYAQRLEDAAAGPATSGLPSSLPSSLKGRLQAIPRQVLACDDVDGLFRTSRRAAHGRGNRDAAAAAHLPAEHLQTCSRCRRLYGCLEDALNEAPQRLPDGLLARLRRIGRQAPRRLPVWVADARYATAACYLVTALLLVLAGDASAYFQATSGVVGERAGGWFERARTDSGQWLDGMNSKATHRVTQSQQWFEIQGEALVASLSDRHASLQDRYRQLSLDPRQWLGSEDASDSTQTEGDSDGRSKPSSP